MIGTFSIKTKDNIDFRYELPINKPLIEEEKNLLIHPYALGVVLGCGQYDANQIVIYCRNSSVLENLRLYLPENFRLSRTRTKNVYKIVRIKQGIENKVFSKFMASIGINHFVLKNKFIPEEYLYGSYAQRLFLLQGLMDTSGSLKKAPIEFQCYSKQLMLDTVNLARSLGICCKMLSTQYQTKRNLYRHLYRVALYTDVNVFTTYPKSKRHHEFSRLEQISRYFKQVPITQVRYICKRDGYCIAVANEDSTYLTKDYIVTHNSFLLAVYATLKCLLYPGTKAVICGAAFRQAKIIFEYMENIWKDAPILQSLCTPSSGPRRDVDRCTIRLNDSFAWAVPLGTGEKIRGMRANLIISDEFNSISPEIYETVIAGFAAVSQDPIQNVQEAAKRKAMQDEGIWREIHEEAYQTRRRNQSILSGTCGYTFEHFYEYWKRYHGIISSKGDSKKLEQLLGDSAETFLKNLDWRDFSIIRIPFELVPEGFLDEKQIMRAKATMHAGIFDMEYSACFTSDSQGFFKRSLIESCVANDANIEKGNWPKWCPLPFDPKTRGHEDYQYVMGVDPASEADNFALVILELHPEHQRVVHVWTTNRNDFKERKKAKLTDITDYYAYCVRKMRDLCRVFNIVRIGIDTQGGGHQISEGLHDEEKMVLGEVPMWEVIDENKEKDTDRMAGLHIIEKINFGKADWTTEANHGLRKDMEDKLLLFPRFDSVTLAMAETYDSENFDKLRSIVGEGKALKLYDTLEDCVLEIQELKDELSTIVMTQTGIVGRDRWDTPEVRLGGKKGRLRKDRYSALVIANMLARKIQRVLPDPEYSVIGRAAKDSYVKNKDSFMGQLYVGNEWAKNISASTCFVVRKK